MMLFASPWTLQAQESTQNLSLERAIAFAIEHNKQLQASQMDIALYQQKVRETLAQGLPQINASANYATNFGHKMSLMGNEIEMKDQSNATASLQQLIFSGQWLVGVQISKIAQQLTEQQVELTALDIRESICNSYYTILILERMKGLLAQNMENMNNIHNHTRNLFKAGVVEETDVDQIRITVGQLKNSMLSLERNIELSNNLMRIQLGIAPGEKIVLTDKLEAFLNEAKIVQSSLQPFNISQNAHFRLVETQIVLNKKLVDLEKWSFAPTLGGSYSYTYKIIKPALDMSPNHSAGISLSLPVFTGFQRRAKLQQARIELEKSQINQGLLEDQLNLQNDQLKFELRNALENYTLQKENIDVASRVLANYKRKYELGALSSMEMTQANSNYLQAENNFNSAVLTLLQAQLNLEKLYNQLPYQQ